MAPSMSKFVNMRLRGSSEYSAVDPETLSSTSSSTMHEDKGLLSGDDQPIYNPRPSSRRRFFSWRNTSVVLSALLFISGISVWGHVVILLRSFRCDTTPLEDKFEPDCKCRVSEMALFASTNTSWIVLFSSRVTFQPHAFYGGPPTNATDEMWQRLQPRKLAGWRLLALQFERWLTCIFQLVMVSSRSRESIPPIFLSLYRLLSSPNQTYTESRCFTNFIAW